MDYTRLQSQFFLAYKQSLIFNPVLFFRRHFNIFCRLTEVLLQKYIKPTLKVSTLNWIEDRSMKRDRTEFFLPLHYIHNYILCLHDFTIDMDSIQKCNSAYKKGVKDISSHEKFILFRFSSRLCWSSAFLRSTQNLKKKKSSSWFGRLLSKFTKHEED